MQIVIPDAVPNRSRPRKGPKSFALTLLALIFAMSAATGVAFAKQEKTRKPESPAYVLVPVFYVTDRDKVGQTFGPNRKYIVNCLHDMYYGVAYIPVANDLDRKPDEVSSRLGWTFENKITSKVSKKDEITADDPNDEKLQFFDRLAHTLDKAESKHACLFVHGGADPFEDACLDAAMISYNMECPTIIYSWPSVGKLNKYRVDEGNCEWTQEHFDTFCEDLQSFEKSHPFDFTLIGHSMGNRVIARSVHVLHKSKPGLVTDVALVSPDVDAETFKHYVMGYHGRGARVRLYVSNRDKVLPFIQGLYGGYYRLGEGVGSVLGMLSPVQQSTFPVAKDGAQPKEVLSAARRRLYRGKRHLEKIDFTDIDQGVIGHNFPFALVASMSRFNTPGAGLTFVPEIAGKGNLMARYAHWKNDLGEDKEAHPGYCKRVVRIDSLDPQLKAEIAAAEATRHAAGTKE